MAINNKNSDVQYYLNTLIYIIILKAIAILSMLLFLFKMGSYISYIILTYQIVLAIIIIFVLYKIITFNKKLKKQREAEMESPAILHNCPNYWTRQVNDDDHITCASSFMTANKRYTYQFVGDNEALPDINITEMQDRSGTMDKLCNSYSEVNHDRYPWIEYKAKCDKL
jgi:heme exporter protein D